jgi:hypothetical protein
VAGKFTGEEVDERGESAIAILVQNESHLMPVICALAGNAGFAKQKGQSVAGVAGKICGRFNAVRTGTGMVTMSLRGILIGRLWWGLVAMGVVLFPVGGRGG